MLYLKPIKCLCTRHCLIVQHPLRRTLHRSELIAASFTPFIVILQETEQFYILRRLLSDAMKTGIWNERGNRRWKELPMPVS